MKPVAEFPGSWIGTSRPERVTPVSLLRRIGSSTSRELLRSNSSWMARSGTSFSARVWSKLGSRGLLAKDRMAPQVFGRCLLIGSIRTTGMQSSDISPTLPKTGSKDTGPVHAGAANQSGDVTWIRFEGSRGDLRRLSQKGPDCDSWRRWTLKPRCGTKQRVDSSPSGVTGGLFSGICSIRLWGALLPFQYSPKRRGTL